MKTLSVLLFLGAIVAVLIAIAIAGRKDTSLCGSDQYFNDGRCQDCNCNEIGSKSPICDEMGMCECQAGVSGDKCDQSPTWLQRGKKKRRLTTMDDDGYVEMAKKHIMALLSNFLRDEKNEEIEDKEALEREKKLQH